MVSEIGKGSSGDWFPGDYANLLTFLTGIRVTAPWVEFRDNMGELVERRHFWLKNEDYREGYSVINEIFHGATGLILSLANKFDEFHTTSFRSLINNLISLNSYSRHHETAMALSSRVGVQLETPSSLFTPGRNGKAWPALLVTILQKAGSKQVTV